MKKKNRLANEKSPYLLQHAYNPVDWYPWSEEAFEEAKKEDKPVFLSIGYSTCHWCHVMEHESFEDNEIAEMMNKAFVSIKVDREERPDIDGIYMTVCQMLTGSGGWPLTIVMTPEKKPFFAGTYFPKDNRFGRTGMKELIPRLNEIWKQKRDDVIRSAEEISSALQSALGMEPGEALKEDIFNKAFRELKIRFDSEFGGFGSAPKFPTPHNFFFLLRYWKRKNNLEALDMVEKTLLEMRKGGIYDHIGFGFHRYSTDRNWLVPHFEKMLYDQALLSIAFIETFQATGENIYKKVAEEILEYVLRDMTSPDGGFYSAEDADSEGIEGKFYLWTIDELKSILDENDAKLIVEFFNLKKEGNWIDSARLDSTVKSRQVNGGSTRTNIIHLKKAVDELAKENPVSGIPQSGDNLSLPAGQAGSIELEKRLERIRKILFEKRGKRIHPYKDDKILTDWNSLMMSAFAKASLVFDEKKYLAAAENTADFILNNLRNENGRLLHRFREGEAGLSAAIDDYSFFIAALLDLYEASFNTKYLSLALELNKDMIKHFWDEKSGGFYFTADDSEELLIRQKEIYDGALPSGNSVAMLNLIRISRFTGDTSFEEKASILQKTFSKMIDSSPSAFTQFLAGLDFAFGPSLEIAIVGKRDLEQSNEMLKEITKKFLPSKILVFKDIDEDKEIEELVPFTKEFKTMNGKTTVFICENYKCNLPVTEIDDLRKLLL